MNKGSDHRHYVALVESPLRVPGSQTLMIRIPL